jgi:hypothetical protein
VATATHGCGTEGESGIPGWPDPIGVSRRTNRERRQALIRAFDPGLFIHASQLEFAVRALDPEWYEQEPVTSPLPREAVEAIEFVTEH